MDAELLKFTKGLATKLGNRVAKENKLGADIPKIVTVGSEMPVFPPTSTGIAPVDRLSGGGFCQSEIWEISGTAGSGKTTMGAYMTKGMQDLNKAVVLIHTEEISKPEEAWALAGVDPEGVIAIQQFQYAENIFDLMKDALIDQEKKWARKEIGLVIIDSFAALFPNRDYKAEQKKGAEAETMMNFAKMTSAFFRSLKGQGTGNGCAIVLINQPRVRISGNYVGEATAGGAAVEYYPKFRLKLTKFTGGLIKAADKKTVIGHTVRAKVVKNNLGRGMHEGTETEYAVMYGKGIDERGPIVREAQSYGIIRKKARSLMIAIYELGDNQLVELDEVKGNPGLERWLDDHPAHLERLAELNQMCRAWIGEHPGIDIENDKVYQDGVEIDLPLEVAKWKSE